VNQPVGGPYALTAVKGRYELRSEGAVDPLRLCLLGEGAAFTIDDRLVRNVLYRVEERRGYEATGELWSPGYFRVDLTRGASATMVGSTEAWDVVTALTPVTAREAEGERRERLLRSARLPQGRAGEPSSAPFDSAEAEFARQLVLASDQFVITPVGRHEDRARARAMGDDVRSVIAGYHWFTDWGRDTMISLEGLALLTGRHVEAGYILRTFAHYIRDGLIPNLFPEGDSAGLYHTADATLWFFHAIDRYVEATGDRMLLSTLVPRLVEIVEHHVRGTRFGIGVDPEDGLLRQGAEGYQLTWMDAKVGDWVVTPRRGKAVEINALWYNALRLLEGWLRELRDEGAAAGMGELAERARRSFNGRFWNKDAGYLYDVVDGESGDDPACRPNQVFALSLRHPVLDPDRWADVLEVVRERLLTPVGLRSLSPDHPDYKPRYDGDLRARDAAYHQGTVWAWLIGPFVDAWLRVHPAERAPARAFLDGFAAELHDACIGSIGEVFDAEPPYTPRGCIAQAWSVAEVFRAWRKTAPVEPPVPGGAASAAG
jgi:predicted glycogen debranching enzyme